VTILLLLRHGTTDLTGKRLYGRSQDIHLSEEGHRQADHLGERLAPLRPSALYSSPIGRCVETAERIAAACRLETQELDGLAEIDYGRWTGRSFASLARTRLWRRGARSRPSRWRTVSRGSCWSTTPAHSNTSGHPVGGDKDRRVVGEVGG
jgi:broad specificity phosphatase PhoE